MLRTLSVHVCGLANNHFFDFGKKGAVDTLSALGKVGILTTGYGENAEDAKKHLIYEKDGERICLVAVCEHEYSYALADRVGCNGFDPARSRIGIEVRFCNLQEGDAARIRAAGMFAAVRALPRCDFDEVYGRLIALGVSEATEDHHLPL